MTPVRIIKPGAMGLIHRSRRSRRGINLLAASLALAIFVGALSTLVKSMVRDASFRQAAEVANYITARAANLDFYLHTQFTPPTPKPTTATVTSVASATVAAAATSTPYTPTNRFYWQILEAVAVIPGEDIALGLIVVRPQNAQARTMSTRVQSELSRRIATGQGSGGEQGNGLDVRSFAAQLLPAPVLKTDPAQLTDDDIVLFSYPLNGIVPFFVRRQAFGGYPASNLMADLSLKDHKIKGAAEVSSNNITADHLQMPAKTQLIADQMTLEDSPTFVSFTVSNAVTAKTAKTKNLLAEQITVSGLVKAATAKVTSRTVIEKGFAANTSMEVANAFAEDKLTTPGISASTISTPRLKISAKLNTDNATIVNSTATKLIAKSLKISGSCVGC